MSPPIRAIDIHVHPADLQSQEELLGRGLAEHSHRPFRTDVPEVAIEELAALDFSAETEEKISVKNALNVLTHPSTRPILERVPTG